MDFVKVARIIQSLIIFFIAISHLNIEWNIINILLIIAMFLSSIILFFGIFLLMASYCFITIHGLEVRNLLTDGGKQMAQYPIGIFRNGKCYLAIDNDVVVGLIMGCLRCYDEYDYLDYKCPKCGEVTELVVSKKVRSSGIGTLLINRIEKYFKSIGCEYISIEVFAYNKMGINFYEKHGYHTRGLIDIKKIN